MNAIKKIGRIIRCAYMRTYVWLKKSRVKIIVCTDASGGIGLRKTEYDPPGPLDTAQFFVEHVSYIIPWHNEEYAMGIANHDPSAVQSDKILFASLTRGGGNNAIIMGNNTARSIGRLLPNRVNVVLTRAHSVPLRAHSGNVGELRIDGAVYETALLDAIYGQLAAGRNIVWLCGGEGVYREGSKYASEVYMTQLAADYGCNIMFPQEAVQGRKMTKEVSVGDTGKLRIYM